MFLAVPGDWGEKVTLARYLGYDVLSSPWFWFPGSGTGRLHLEVSGGSVVSAIVLLQPEARHSTGSDTTGSQGHFVF